jgi:hypothetical protein
VARLLLYLQVIKELPMKRFISMSPSLLGSIVCLAIAGCLGGDECDSSFQSKCDGETYEYCQHGGGDFFDQNLIEKVDCAASGQTCAATPTGAECVDKPLVACTASSSEKTCSTDAQSIKRCGASGYVTTWETCDSGARCIEEASNASCEIPAGLACSGSGELCSTDKRSTLFCHQGQAYLEGECSADRVCVEKEGKAACFDSPLVPCDETTRSESCSKDRTRVLTCADAYGYSYTSEACSETKVCVELLDSSYATCLEPRSSCSASGQTCSADESEVLYCRDGQGYLLYACEKGKSCVSNNNNPSCV